MHFRLGESVRAGRCSQVGLRPLGLGVIKQFGAEIEFREQQSAKQSISAA